MNKLLINMSGHPLSDRATAMSKDRGFTVLDVPVPNVNVSDPSNIVDFVKSTINPLIDDDDTGKSLKTGDFVLIPPGFSVLSLVAVSTLHGITGHFPRILWLVRDADGMFSLLDSDPLDLQSIRTASRDSRAR